ncbi:SDR family oxidoreductase [Candidatus Pelagibacter sp.]|jgi:3-oxoacyl-[acyl-carrier protein] reductase|nr:SDR family oxidoreductase [Candidatus Pelagibacter sp.]
MKTVIITGANKGIGLASSRLLSKKYNIIGIARKKINNFPGTFIACDLSNEAEINELCEFIKKKYKKIYGIVNNAGASYGQSVKNFDLKTFDKSINLNLRAAIHLSKEFVDQMIKNKEGRVINIASRAALGRENRTSYSAAKSGLYGFTRTWALELAKHNITVNTISPGPILTELQKKNNNQSKNYKKKFLSQNPMGRFGKPEEVANAVDFFISEKSSFITGQCLYVCGGMSVGHSPI